MKYMASIEFDGTVHHYGEGNTPDEAFVDFAFGDGLFDHCSYHDIKNPEGLNVLIYEKLTSGDPDFDDELADENGWSWMAGNIVETREINQETMKIKKGLDS